MAYAISLHGIPSLKTDFYKRTHLELNYFNINSNTDDKNSTYGFERLLKQF